MAGKDVDADAGRIGAEKIPARIEDLPVVSVGQELERGRTGLHGSFGAGCIGDRSRRLPNRKGCRGIGALLATVSDDVAFRRDNTRDSACVVVRRRCPQSVASIPIAGVAGRKGENQASTKQGRRKHVSHRARVLQVGGRIKYQSAVCVMQIRTGRGTDRRTAQILPSRSCLNGCPQLLSP